MIKYKDFDKLFYGKESNQESSVGNQINNYKARMEASGVDPKKATDSRNSLEKFLGLTQDQNVLFDLFELLNRPQQALFGAWKAAQEGEDVGKAAWEGFKGDKETNFKEILKNAGMEENEDKHFELADILGFAGDVLLDPVDLIPLAGFSKAAKVLDDGGSLLKAYKATDSASDLVLKGIGKGLKGGAKLADKGVEAGLKSLDAAKGVKNAAGDIVKIGYGNASSRLASELLPKALDKTADITNATGRLERYKGLKNFIDNTFKLSDSAKATARTKSLYAALSEKAGDAAKIEIKNIQETAEKFAKMTDNVYGDANKLLDDAYKMVSSTVDRTMKESEVLALALKGELPAREEAIEHLRKMLKRDVPDEVVADIIQKYGQGALDITTTKANTVKLGKGWNDLSFSMYKGQGRPRVVKFNKMYTKDQDKYIKELISRYNENANGYGTFVDEVFGNSWTKKNFGSKKFAPVSSTDNIIKGGVDRLNDILDKNIGSNLSTKYNFIDNSDYVAARILTEEGKSITKDVEGLSTFLNSRRYVGSPDEINNFVRGFVDSLDDKALKNNPELLAFKKNKNAKFMETDYIKALTNNYASSFDLTDVAGTTGFVTNTLLDNVFNNYKDINDLQKKIEIAQKSGKDTTKLLDKYNAIMENSAIKPITKFNSKVPDNFTVISNEQLQSFINKFSVTNKKLGNNDQRKALSNLLRSVSKNGNKVAINNDVVRMLNIASNTKTVSELNKAYNSWLNIFKRWKTASPTNFLNNLMGNSSNLALGGISMQEQAKLGPKVLDIMQNGKEYYLRRLSGDLLDSKANEIADLWEEFRKLGFGDASLDLAELPEDLRDIIQKKKELKGAKDYIKNGLPALFGSLNQKGDVASRLTIMLKAKEDPAFLKKLGAKDAYEAISKIMFDPTALTTREKAIKQIIPFYTYTKNNLVYQVSNIQNNGAKYNKLMKSVKGLRDSATNGNADDMADYIKSNLYVPIPGLDKDGNYTVLRASLPFGQLTDMIDDPMKGITSMLSPAIKAPIEYATGVDSFTGNPIESFPGQKSSQIPFLTKKQQKALSDLSGLDVPLKNFSRIAEGVKNSENGFFSGLGRGIADTAVMTNNINTDKLYKQYDELEELKNLMKLYEQKGYEFATINELKKANKNKTLTNLDAIFAKYGIKGYTLEDKLKNYMK